MTLTAKRESRADMPVKENYFRAAPPTVDEPVHITRNGGAYRAGLMSEVSLIQHGEALGHGMWIDHVTLSQVAEHVNQLNKGIKSRFTHPGMSSDGLGRHLGRVTDAVVVGDRVLGDLHFAKSAHDTPDGNLAEYVMTLAEEDPQAAGLSIVFEHDPDAEDAFVSSFSDTSGSFESPDPGNINNYPHVRLKSLRAADVVDEPAANREGMFDRQDMPRQADQLLSYATGLSDERPTPCFGLDPDRVSAFLSRWLADHDLQLSELRAMTPEQVTPEAPAPVTREDLLSELKKYTDQFGAEYGADLYANDVSFEQGLLEQVAALKAENDELKGRLAEAEDRCKQIQLGESSPVDVADIQPKQRKNPVRFSASEN